MEWPDNLVLDLIRDIQYTPLLWNSKDPCFKLPRKKDNAWLQLAYKYRATVEEVKKKWMSVRASYRREKARVAERSQTEREFTSSWFAYSAMLFYDGRYKPRRVNVKRLMRELDPMDQLDDDDAKDFQGDDETDEEFEDTEGHTPPPDSAFKTTSTATSTTVPQPQRQLKVRKLQRLDDSSFGASHSHHTNCAPDESSRKESLIFGEYVGQKLRKFDARTRAIAIHHINGILFNAEMGQYKHSFVDVAGGLQIPTQRIVGLPTSDTYFFGRGEQHLSMDSTSSMTKHTQSKVIQPIEENFLNGTPLDEDEVELKVLQQNELYQSQ